MKHLKHLLPVIIVALFGTAIWVLHRSIAEFHYHEIAASARAIPRADLLLAVGLTALSYLVMSAYDLLAVRYLKHSLEKGKVLLASFISYAFSNNIGLSILAAGSLRYRLYSSWGLSGEEITKLVTFTIVTFWLGLIGIGGLVFSTASLQLGKITWLGSFSVTTVGWCFLAVSMTYLAFLLVRKTPFQLRSWEFSIPSPGMGIAQIVIGVLDWALAGSVLYVLLPNHLALSFQQLLAIYLLSQLIALISHIPGGLGVFESMVLMFAPQGDSAALLGSLVLFRAIYYLLPLALATSLLTYTELFKRTSSVSKALRTLVHWSTLVTPQLLALTTLIGGAVLLFSGATPTIPHRLHWLNKLIPLSLVQLSHFLGSLVGAVLLLLARGIQRRLDAAYILTIALLTAGSLLSLIKGVDYEEAIVLGLMVVALLPCRRYFYRKSSLLAEGFSPQWIVLIALIFISSTWLGFFSYRHVAYSQQLWWDFALHADASRFLRAAVGAGILLLLFALAKILRPVLPEPPTTDQDALEKARTIISKAPGTEANLALLGDKTLLFDPDHNGFVMYAIQGSSWIAMGDPVAPEKVSRDLAWQFRELVEQHGGQPVFYEVGPDMLPIYLDMGLSLYKLGEEARVPLAQFSLQGSKRSGLRYTKRKLEKEGCIFEVYPAEQVADLMPELQNISDQWLGVKNSREKGFSLGFFKPEYLLNFPVALVKQNDTIIAFANLWQSAEKQELSIDLMRYLPDAPNGIMEYLFIELMLWGQQQGYQYFSLGMAPLAGMENRPFAPLWHRIGALLFRHGEHFYNFEGLRKYKDKFDPEWEPRYLACPGGFTLPKVLTNTAALIGGGIKGIFGK